MCVDEDRRPVCDLLHRCPACGDHGNAAGHRLQDGNPEALVERRVREARGTTVEARELGIVDLAEPTDAVPADVDLAPAPRADDAELQVGAADCLDEARSLRGSSVPTASTYSPPSDWTFARELLADGVGHDADLLVRHSE